MDDVRPLRDEVVEHAHRQAQGQEQRGRPVEGQAEAQHIHHLQQRILHWLSTKRMALMESPTLCKPGEFQPLTTLGGLM